MTIKIEVSFEFHATAARLLRENGYVLDKIVGNEVFLTEGVEAEAYAALADLQTEGAKDVLAQAKRDALAVARATAIDIRRTIAESAPLERAVAWVNKVQYAIAWATHEAQSDPNGPLAAVATTAEAGFQIEADVTGETAIFLRDRTIAKNAVFFKATQLVEGMERLAETVIPDAVDQAALDVAIAQLRDLEQQAMAQLATITGGA